MSDRFTEQLRGAEPGVRELLGRIPPEATAELPGAWLRCEMLERFQLIESWEIPDGTSVLEVGAGAHALATVPLAYRVGPRGRVIAAERARWSRFRSIVAASGLDRRVRPVACDARRLPLCDGGADLAVCVHGLRSIGELPDAVRVVREMLRTAPRVVLAESLPTARTNAQRAHLAMYDLREEVFLAHSGRRDDLRYVPVEGLARLAELAGGVVDHVATREVDLPHYLARFPRDLVEELPAGPQRDALLARWDAAEKLRREFGEDHPPVGVVTAHRKG